MEWVAIIGGAAGILGGLVSAFAAWDARRTRKLAEEEASRRTEGAVIDMRVRSALQNTAGLFVFNAGSETASDVQITIDGRGGPGTQRVADKIHPGIRNGVLITFPLDLVAASRGPEPESHVDTTVWFKTPAGTPMRQDQSGVLVFVHRKDLGL